MKKRISVLGSTGSIGRQTLEVVDMFPEMFEVVGLAAGTNFDLLVRQAQKYRPAIVSIAEKNNVSAVRAMLPDEISVSTGLEGMIEVAVAEGVDIVVTSVTGTLGLIPTVEAVKAGKNIALANKETLVAAGELVKTLADAKGVSLLPVDSEHSAVFQCLIGENRQDINKLILTASGGPFFNKSREELLHVTLEDALKHPNWSMGRKITVDSATMMNKGLEVIEAHWLFGIELERIEVLVHPQSIIHSMVEFADGSVKAQLGLPDMRLPIQYALSYPRRISNDFPRLDLLSVGKLTFDEPRTKDFPCLELAYEAGRQGGTMPAVMNAANEKAVAMFLEGQIGFLGIPSLIEKVMVNHRPVPGPDLATVLESDQWAREEAERVAGN